MNLRQNKILLDTDLYWNLSLSSFTSVRTTSPIPLSISIPFQWLFWKDPLAQHLNTRPTALKVSQVSNTTGTPPTALDSIHRPLCQAPGLGSFIANAIDMQGNVSNRLVDFQCFRKGLWTKNVGKPCDTMWNLRTFKAICDTNIIKPHLQP